MILATWLLFTSDSASPYKRPSLYSILIPNALNTLKLFLYLQLSEDSASKISFFISNQKGTLWIHVLYIIISKNRAICTYTFADNDHLFRVTHSINSLFKRSLSGGAILLARFSFPSFSLFDSVMSPRSKMNTFWAEASWDTQHYDYRFFFKSLQFQNFNGVKFLFLFPFIILSLMKTAHKWHKYPKNV